MLPMRIGKQSRSYRLRTTPMRDSEGRLLGTVTTLEDVTTLQDTDRFKTQFISVASKKLRDPLLQLRRGIYALQHGFGGELLPLQSELVVEAGNEAEKLSDLMADLIEVAELDTGKREFKLERLRPLPLLDEARNRYIDEAAPKRSALKSAPSRTCRSSWPIAVRSAPSSTIWWAMRCVIRRPTVKSFSPPKS